MTDNSSPIHINTEEIQSKLLETLSQNGDLSEREHRRMVLLTLTSMHYMIMQLTPLSARVKKLENTSIILWISKHKALTFSFILPATILLVMFFHEISPWVMKNLEVIAGFGR
jgi:hypothetical protein